MARFQDFLLNSDYPIDKIVFLREVQIPVSANTNFSETIAHKLGSTPFCNAVFSTDGWNTTYQSGAQEMDDSGQSFIKKFVVASDESNVYIKGVTNISGTVAVRVWGVFQEDNTYNVDAPPTSANTSFIINSDYNYPSLVKDGVVDATSSPVSIEYKLGYIPFTDLWIWHKEWDDSSYRWYPVSYAFSTGWLPHSQPGAPTPPEITSSALILKNGKYYYRIYGDDTTL